MKQRTYTPKNRALIHAALVEAKSRLSRSAVDPGRVTFICFAICLPGEEPTLGQCMARDMIMSRLQGYSTVVSWLSTNSPKFCVEASVLGMRAMDDAIQAYRHRWLDALIEEFSDSGSEGSAK